MATKFPRFPDLPVNIQAQIWKHAICNPALPNEFRWAIAGQWLEFQSYAKAKWVKGANVTCERKWHQEFCDRNIGLRSWKGKYRTLQIVDYSRYGGSLSALKEFFNIISTCCRARFVGLEWWKGEIERGDSEFERGFFEWDSDDTTPSQDSWMEQPEIEDLESSKKAVVGVLAECLQDVEWMGNNPGKKRGEPPKWWEDCHTKTFHAFEKLPMELKIIIWDLYIAEFPQTEGFSSGPFRDFREDFREELGCDIIHKFLGTSSSTAVYYTWLPHKGLSVCRLSRWLALRSWYTMLKEHDKPDHIPGYLPTAPPYDWNSGLRSLVLRVIGELLAEVKGRLDGAILDKAGCRNSYVLSTSLGGGESYTDYMQGQMGTGNHRRQAAGHFVPIQVVSAVRLE